jgi:hypothetical protein
MSLSLIPAIALQGISGWASRIVGERFFTASPIISIERGMERLKSGQVWYHQEEENPPLRIYCISSRVWYRNGEESYAQITSWEI